MRQKPFWIIAALAGVIGCSVNVRAADVQLRWQLEPGTEWHVELAQRSKTRTVVGDQESSVSINTGLELRWHVDRADADGILHVTQVFRRLRFQSVLPDGQTVAYDSAAEHDASPETKVIADAVRTLLRLRVSMRLSPRGEIVDVQRSAETDSLLGDLPALAGWKSLLTTDGMRRTLQSALGTLPEGPVAVGGTWTVERQTDSPLGRIAATDTYTYEGPAERNQQILERIHVTTRVQRLPRPAAPPGPPAAPADLPSQRLEGVYLFDATAGRLVESHLSQTIEFEVPHGEARIRLETTSTLAAAFRRL